MILLIGMNKFHARKQLLAAFDPHAYERPRLSSQEMMEIKIIFDMFDSDATGLVKVEGTLFRIQK